MSRFATTNCPTGRWPTAHRSWVLPIPGSPRQDDCKVGQEGLQIQGDERWECVDMGAEESLFQCLEQVPDPRRARECAIPFRRYCV